MENRPEFIYSSEIRNLPSYIIKKFSDFLNENEVSYSLMNDSFIVEFRNQFELEKITDLATKIKQAPNYIESLLLFEDLDPEDLFIFSPYLPFIELIPYLNKLEQKGIIFNFNKDNENDYAIDGLHCVNVISHTDYQKHIQLEEINYYLWSERCASSLAEAWMVKIGFNSLGTSFEQKRQVEHIIDFLNHFDYELGLLEDAYSRGEISVNQFKDRKNTIEKEMNAAKNSSLQENLVKANHWISKKNKKLTSREDWSGLLEVYSSGEFKFYQLLSPKSKDRESYLLNHCVGQGGYDDTAGIYSVRTLDNIPLATIEVSSSFKVEQIQGEYNREITDLAILTAIRNFVSSYLHVVPDELEDLTNSGWNRLSLVFVSDSPINSSRYISEEYELFFPAGLTPEAVDSLSKIILPSLNNWEQIMLDFIKSKEYLPTLSSHLIMQFKDKPPFIKITDFLGFNLNNSLIIFNSTYSKVHRLIQFFNRNRTLLKKEINDKISLKLIEAKRITTSIEANRFISKCYSDFSLMLKTPYALFSQITFNLCNEYNSLITTLSTNNLNRLEPLIPASYTELDLLTQLLIPDPTLRHSLSLIENDLPGELTNLSTLTYELSSEPSLAKSCSCCNESTIKGQVVTLNKEIKLKIYEIEKIFSTNKTEINYIFNLSSISSTLNEIFLEYAYGNKEKAIAWLTQELSFTIYKNKQVSLKTINTKQLVEKTYTLLNEILSLNKKKYKKLQSLQDCFQCYAKRDTFITESSYIKELEGTALNIKASLSTVDKIITALSLTQLTQEKNFIPLWTNSWTELLSLLITKK